MRDRKCNDKTHWCKEPIYSFFQTKLQSSNKQKFFLNLNLKKIFSIEKFTHNNHKYNMIQILGIKIKYKCK